MHYRRIGRFIRKDAAPPGPSADQAQAPARVVSGQRALPSTPAQSGAAGQATNRASYLSESFVDTAAPHVTIGGRYFRKIHVNVRPPIWMSGPIKKLRRAWLSTPHNAARYRRVRKFNHSSAAPIYLQPRRNSLLLTSVNFGYS
jgi:hypothetical protein